MIFFKKYGVRGVCLGGGWGGGLGVVVLKFHFYTLGGRWVPILCFEGREVPGSSWSNLYPMPKILIVFAEVSFC